MKSIVLKSNSWHRWISDNFGSSVGNTYDICSYTRSVVWGMIVFLVACIVISAAVTILLTGIITPFLIWTGHNVWKAAQIAMIMDAVAFVLILVSFLYSKCETWYEEYKDNKLPEVKRGFISHAWHAFKEKTCIRLEFTGK